jgi:endonuclease G, mitochondrial
MPIVPISREVLQGVAAEIARLSGMNSPAKQAEVLTGGLPDGVPITINTGDARFVVYSALNSLNNLGMHSSGVWPILEVARHALYLADETDRAKPLAACVSTIEAYYARATQPEPSHPFGAPQPEAVIGYDKRVNQAFLDGAIRAGKSVGLLRFALPNGRVGAGTAWLLTSKHLITNWHVPALLKQGLTLQDLDANAANATCSFDYHEKREGALPVPVPGRLRVICGDPELDYAVLELAEKIADRQPLTLGSSESCTPGQRLNIPQYPQGGPLRFGIRENVFVARPAPGVLHYITDTEYGSSGSPVCDDEWNVVALHHAFRNVPSTSILGMTVNVYNEGIAIEAIRAHLPAGILA